MTYPPHQPLGQGQPPQPYQQPPQQYSQPQYGQQQGQPYPQQPFPGQPGQQPWGQQQPQQQWAPQPPGGPQPPKSKLPIVLGVAAAAVVVLIVIGLVAVTSGGDSDTTAAQATTTTAAQSAAATTTKSSSTTSSATKSTTSSKSAPSQLSPAATTIVQAFPETLRQSVLKNSVTEKDPTGTMDTFTKKIVGTIVASDALTAGLMHHQNIEHYPIAWIDTDAAKLRRIWNSQHPERTTDEGAKLVRIDPSYPNGSAALEVFIPSSNLYFSMSGFKNADAAKQFVQRAGF